MSDSKSVIKAVVASVLVIGIVMGASCSKSPDEKSAAPPKSVETLFVIERNNFDFTLSHMDQYLAGVSPIPMGISMLVRMQLGGILGDPQLGGLNMGGKFRIIGMLLPDDSGKAEPLSRMLVAAWLPVSDYDKLVGSNPKFSKPDKNGISELTVSLAMPGMPTDPNAPPSGPAMLITKLDDKHALIGSRGQYDKLVAYMKIFSGSKSADPFAGIVAKSDYPISIYGDVQTASKAFGPLLHEKIEKIKTTITDMESNTQAKIEKIEEMRNNLADTDSNKADIDGINQQIQGLKDQQSDLQEVIQELEQETSRLANIDPNEKADVEKLQKQIKIMKERTELASNIQQAIEKLEQARNNLANSNQAVTDQLDKQIQGLKEQQDRSSALQSTSQETIAKVMDMYIGLLETLMKEVKSFTIAVKPGPDVLFIKETIAAVPGTNTAAMLIADPQAGEKNELLGYLKNGAAMNFAMKKNKPFLEKYVAAVTHLMGTLSGQSISDEDMTTIRNLTANAIDSIGKSAVGTLAGDTEGKSMFDMDYVIEVADADKFNKLIDGALEMLKTSGILDFYKGIGIEMDFTLMRNTETYKGVPIDSAKLTMKSTEPNAPMGQMIDLMYGGGFDYRWGITDGLCTMAIGGDVDAKVHKLIDLVKAGGPKEICSEVKDALEMLPKAEKADFFVTYNYVRLIKMVGRIMPMGPDMAMPSIDIPTKSNINIAGTIASGQAVIDIALPKQHVSEIITAFIMLQQEMMKQQGAMSTKATIKTLDTAMHIFAIDTGRFPTEEEGLMALAQKPANADWWKGPYIKDYMPKDAWNRDFVYEVDADGKKFKIISYGADGKEGGEGPNKDLFSTD